MNVLSWIFCLRPLSRIEKEPDDWTSHDRTYMVGLCTGLLSAAAISSTPTVSTLIPLAVQTVLIAFRTGLYVNSLSERLHPVLSRSESWTMIFPGVGEEEAKNATSKFHASNVSLTGIAHFPRIWRGKRN